MRTIDLTQGKVALVDDADYEFLNQWKWHAGTQGSLYTFYAIRQLSVAGGKQRHELMHRLILGLKPSDKRQCDHRDRNGLNNQRSNLRACTRTQNQQSSRKRTGSTSRYKGVCWDSNGGKWRSQVYVKKRQIHLGCFVSETDAARAYDAAALRYYGSFAITNEMLRLL